MIYVECICGGKRSGQFFMRSGGNCPGGNCPSGNRPCGGAVREELSGGNCPGGIYGSPSRHIVQSQNPGVWINCLYQGLPRKVQGHSASILTTRKRLLKFQIKHCFEYLFNTNRRLYQGLPPKQQGRTFHIIAIPRRSSQFQIQFSYARSFI